MLRYAGVRFNNNKGEFVTVNVCCRPIRSTLATRSRNRSMLFESFFHDLNICLVPNDILLLPTIFLKYSKGFCPSWLSNGVCEIHSNMLMTALGLNFADLLDYVAVNPTEVSHRPQFGNLRRSRSLPRKPPFHKLPKRSHGRIIRSSALTSDAGLCWQPR